MADYYTILEVSPTATLAEIKRAYRRLVRQYHPDLNKEALDIHIKRLNEAYDILGDAVRRAAYDALRLEAARVAAAQELLRHQQTRAQVKQEPEMTWVEGVFGFVRELKKELRDDS